MNVVFRTDASIRIGTGHVMRCLTLAQKLRDRGARCTFVCRKHPGNLLEYLETNGFRTISLPIDRDGNSRQAGKLTHASWLGSDWERDAQSVCSSFPSRDVDWLVVDHYALDECWETALRPFCRRLMAIDDLADRKHNCDLLLDQTWGRSADDYFALTPDSCTRLVGSCYAMLRPEFAQWRSASLIGRSRPKIQRILVMMGGADPDNVTGQVLQSLKQCNLPDSLSIAVIVGATAPCREIVQEFAKEMPWPTEIHIAPSNVAELMTRADLAIGAAGSSAWERCCLGLPSIVLVLAANQEVIARNLDDCGAAKRANLEVLCQLISWFDECRLREMSRAASAVTDGTGVSRIAAAMTES